MTPYDIETYRNFFCVTFGTKEDNTYFEISAWQNDLDAIKEYVKGKTLVGYNNHEYDDLILNYILQTTAPPNILNAILFSLSKKIIANGFDQQIKSLKWWWKKPYKSIDLMRLHSFHKSKISLKQVGINLKHNLVQDLPIKWDETIKESDRELLKKYNLNDLVITQKLLDFSKQDLDLRAAISEEYEVDVMSADRSKIANTILNHYYAEATGHNKKQFFELRTERKEIPLSEVISNKIRFQTVGLQQFLDELKGETLIKKFSKKAKKDCFSFEKVLNFGSKTYDIGVGGLHSRDDPEILESDSEYLLIDADVGSFYPMIMLNDRVKPEHLENKFLDVLKDITYQRLEAKKLQKKDHAMKLKAEVLKITINSIFGKLGSEFYWLYDHKAMFQVTVNGQLYLLMLIERLEDNGFEIVSANTDGITAKIQRSKRDLYDAICDQWQKDTGFTLEFAEYSKIIRKDVNNYLAILYGDLKLRGDGSINLAENIKEGLIKVKGVFDPEIRLEKGYRHPIVRTAFIEWLLNGVEIEDTINSCQDIYQFLISQKTGSEYGTNEYDSLGNIEKQLQKNNRYYVGYEGQIVMKARKDGSRKTSLVAGEKLVVANDIFDSASYLPNVKKDWYIGESYKVADKIKPRRFQLYLF